MGTRMPITSGAYSAPRQGLISSLCLQLRVAANTQGFEDRDMVALSGAHTVGSLGSALESRRSLF